MKVTDKKISIGILYCKTSHIRYSSDISFYLFPIGKRYNIIDWYVEHMSLMGVDIVFIVSDELVHQELFRLRKRYVFDFSVVLEELGTNTNLVEMADKKKSHDFFPKTKGKKKIIPIVVHNMPDVLYDQIDSKKTLHLFFSIYDVHTIFSSMLENSVVYYVADASYFFPFSYRLRTKEGIEEIEKIREQIASAGVLFSHDGKDVRDGVFLPFTVPGERIAGIGGKIGGGLEQKKGLDLDLALDFLNDSAIVEVEKVYDLSFLKEYGRLLLEQETSTENEVFFGLYNNGIIRNGHAFSATYLLDYISWK